MSYDDSVAFFIGTPDRADGEVSCDLDTKVFQEISIVVFLELALTFGRVEVNDAGIRREARFVNLAAFECKVSKFTKEEALFFGLKGAFEFDGECQVFLTPARYKSNMSYVGQNHDADSLYSGWRVTRLFISVVNERHQYSPKNGLCQG